MFLIMFFSVGLPFTLNTSISLNSALKLKANNNLGPIITSVFALTVIQ